MKPRRFALANAVYRLEGGNEDNDLWVQKGSNETGPFLRSLWVPTEKERDAIVKGQNVALWIWSHQMPPVGMNLTAEKPGKAPS